MSDTAYFNGDSSREGLNRRGDFEIYPRQSHSPDGNV